MIQTTQYLKTLLREKGISEDYTFEIKSDGLYGNHYVPMEVVIEFIDSLNPTYQYMIHKKLIGIDFKNGDILHFLEYITKGMIQLNEN